MDGLFCVFSLQVEGAMSLTTARVAPEKLDKSTSLPIVFMDDERTIMEFSMSNVDATLCLKPVPTVFLRTPDLHGVHTYLASQFIDCAAKGSKFSIGPLWGNESPVFIDENEVGQFAEWIRSKCDGGRFQTIWIDSDPALPF